MSFLWALIYWTAAKDGFHGVVDVTYKALGEKSSPPFEIVRYPGMLCTKSG